VDVLRTEDREHPLPHGDEIVARLEERDVAGRVVGLALARLRDVRVAHPLDAADHVLHVDVPAVRFPDTFLRRTGRVLLHQREQAIAVEIVAPDGQRRRVSSPQVLQRPNQQRRQGHEGGAAAKMVEDHGREDTRRQKTGDRRQETGDRRPETPGAPRVDVPRN
jgi:hypothetical protein